PRSVTPIVAVESLVLSATLVAVTVYTPATFGAVYVTENALADVSVPHPEPEQEVPETAQVTPLPVESFVTVAVSVTDRESVKPTAGGVIATLIPAPCGAGAGAATHVNTAGPSQRVAATAIPKSKLKMRPNVNSDFINALPGHALRAGSMHVSRLLSY
ncbi:MAG TPA: hypothetical protein VN682_10910, partial [Terriglobales bacterium]|nr:hypothetical protein [Terriglobales bacterium]